MSEEKVECTNQEKETLLLIAHGEILKQLSQFEKFQQFIALNYEIKYEQNEETKTAGFKVREFSQEEQTILVQKALEKANKGDIIVANEQTLKDFDKKAKKLRR